MTLEDKNYPLEEFLDLVGEPYNGKFVSFKRMLYADIDKCPSSISYLGGVDFWEEKINVFRFLFIRENYYRAIKIPDAANVREYLKELNTEENPLSIHVIPEAKPMTCE